MSPHGWARNDLASAVLESSADRLIVGTRMAVTVLAVGAFLLNPDQQTPVTSVLIAAYVLYSGGIGLLSLSGSRGFRTNLAIHAADIAFFAALMHFTYGPNSPFFIFFTFVLFSATLRWDWKGALGTAVVLVLVFLFIEIISVPIPDEESIGTLIIRAGYLLILGVMLAYLGAIRERSRDRLLRLAGWPPETMADPDHPPLTNALAHACEVLGAERALVVWELTEEPYLFRAHFFDGTLRFDRQHPRLLKDLVAPELADETFVLFDAAAGDFLSKHRRRIERLPPLAAELVREFDIARAVVAPMSSAHMTGHVLFINVRNLHEALLPLAEIAASHIDAEIENHMLRQQLVADASLRERTRLARDLHDGMLQGLTAVALQVKALASQARGSLKHRLEEVQGTLSDQQRRLRDFVHVTRQRNAEYHLAEDRLAGVLRDIEAQWRCETELVVVPANMTLPSPMAMEISLMVIEAAANAVRHGNATKVKLKVWREDGRLQMTIRDNGRGVGWAPGDGEEIVDVSQWVEPLSLRERVDELGGKLSLRSSRSGVAVTIELPL